MEEQKEVKSVTQRLDEIQEILKDKKKVKKFKLPQKAKVSGSRIKKGYITIQVINENKGVDFIREQVIDGTFKLGDTYHAVADYDVLSYKNKPFIIQAKNKLNPYNPLEGKHETYGQKYIMARMEGDKLTSKKKVSWGIIVIGALLAIGAIYLVLKGGIF